ncbi:MAG TPA: metallophosphoesterase [Pyrinomonadaceae bacterium]|nr:metallophosphoesterase [Pyrinomonadaceae bacterium]
MEKTVVVISDLHVGKGDCFNIFASTNKYSLFDTFLVDCKNLSERVELIINGDFVDFLQLQPWNDLTRPTALRKIKEIVAGSEEVFSSIGKFLDQSQHELKILLGNHDVELAYPEVGGELKRAILKFAPDAESRILLFDRRTTYNPRVNGVLLHIEHGNGGDPWNALDYSAIFRDAELNTQDFAYPPGTALVYEVMNGFKEDLRFVDLLKPEIPAVPLLLLALNPMMTSKAVPEALSLVFRALKNGFLTCLRERISGHTLGEVRHNRVSAPELLAAELASTCVSGAPFDNLQIELLEEYLNGSSSVAALAEASLGRHPEHVKLKLVLWALKGLTRFKTLPGEDDYSQDYPSDMAARGARLLLRGDVKVVVFGHTHEALKTEFAEGLYVNAGTWANLIRMPQANSEALLAWANGLSTNSFEITSNPTFVQIDPHPEGVTVSLKGWTEAGQNTLWTTTIRAV